MSKHKKRRMHIQTGTIGKPNNIVKERVLDNIVAYIRKCPIGTQITVESLLIEYCEAGGTTSKEILERSIHQILAHYSFAPDTSVEDVVKIKDWGGRDPRIQREHHLLKHLEADVFERVQGISSSPRTSPLKEELADS